MTTSVVTSAIPSPKRDQPNRDPTLIRCNVMDQGPKEQELPRRLKPLGKGELEILRYVQDHHPVTVRAITEHVASAGGQARTTVLTVMERLRRKGYLRRSKLDGVNHYSPTRSDEEVLDRTVREFVDGMLGGSVSPFVSYLARAEDLDDQEIAQLRALVRKLGRPGKKGPRE